MSSAPPPPRTVRCPACGGPSQYAPDNPYRPFCSERCKNLDFGAWASERYRVPAPSQASDPDDPGSSAPVH
ncbi:DNA gyrase inhibitor YacG [Caldimonas taiwanensis]|uniref:DNA gyrase inhibitor YacG n=1 Tax=Caldimonas taiwanensis TaxID=307483 RepID=UPI000A017469|nr:DNA gyrase inhibitor YacG [Caldimonas taiwanensis]